VRILTPPRCTPLSKARAAPCAAVRLAPGHDAGDSHDEKNADVDRSPEPGSARAPDGGVGARRRRSDGGNPHGRRAPACGSGHLFSFRNDLAAGSGGYGVRLRARLQLVRRPVRYEPRLGGRGLPPGPWAARPGGDREQPGCGRSTARYLFVQQLLEHLLRWAALVRAPRLLLQPLESLSARPPATHLSAAAATAGAAPTARSAAATAAPATRHEAALRWPSTRQQAAPRQSPASEPPPADELGSVTVESIGWRAPLSGQLSTGSSARAADP